jgi:hypothetical protein
LSPLARHLHRTSENVARFLAHFPFVEYLGLTIYDEDCDLSHLSPTDDVGPNKQGSYVELMRMLQPVSKRLVTLGMVCPIYEHRLQAEYLKYVIPGEGFKAFPCLEHLDIPYQCIFEATDWQWSHISPPPPQLLPSTIRTLSISHAQIYVYDWLARIPRFRHELPVLSYVGITCISGFGDSYEVFAFTSYPHPVLAALKSIEVELKLHYYPDEWEVDWYDYDVPLLDNLPWFDSFGQSCIGTLYPTLIS